MKLQQLRYVVETYRHNLNVSEAAEALFTSQPGVSKQIRLLEDELGVQIFIRSGKRIVSITPAGRAVLDRAEHILREVQKIKKIGGEFSSTQQAILTIAATPTILRFKLPETISAMMKQYENIQFHFKSGTSQEIADWVFRGDVDLGWTNQMLPNRPELKQLSGKSWQYALICPQNHALAQIDKIDHLTWQAITRYPLITYEQTSQSPLNRALLKEEIDDANFVLFSQDNDLIENYVGLGLGVAIVDKMACEHLSVYNPKNLVVRDITHLLEPTSLFVLMRPDIFWRDSVADLIEQMMPELHRARLEQLLYAPAVQDFSI